MLPKNTSTKKKKVRFGNVTVKEYPIRIGLNPACTSGSPIQLDWNPTKTRTYLNLECYEFRRRRVRQDQQQPRSLMIPADIRCKMLFLAGYSLEDVVQATLEVRRARQHRAETLKKDGCYDRFSTFISRTGKVPKGLLVGAVGTTLIRRVQTTIISSGRGGASNSNSNSNNKSRSLLKRAKSIPRDMMEGVGSTWNLRRKLLLSPSIKEKTKPTILPEQKTDLARMA